MDPGFAQGSQYRATMEATKKQLEPLLATNEALAAAVQTQFKLAAPPQVITRRVDSMTPGALKPGTDTPSDIALLSDLDRQAPHWWIATTQKSGDPATITIANPLTVRSYIGFERGMAAYALLNDLEGGDRPFPREGCAALFDAWLGFAPAVVDRLHSAIAQEPSRDPQVEANVRAAWLRLTQDRHLQDLGRQKLNAETIKRIGPHPPVIVVYRDPGLPGDGVGEINVVRIGGAIHTYAIIAPVPGKPVNLGSGPFCVVGDLRCGAYMSWP